MRLAQEHNAVTRVRLEAATPRSQDKHSTAEPLCSREFIAFIHSIDEDLDQNLDL